MCFVFWVKKLQDLFLQGPPWGPPSRVENPPMILIGPNIGLSAHWSLQVSQNKVRHVSSTGFPNKRCPIAKILKRDIFHYFTLLIITK